MIPGDLVLSLLRALKFQNLSKDPLKYLLSIVAFVLFFLSSCTPSKRISSLYAFTKTLDIDTAEVKVFAVDLERKLNASPNDLVVAKQLDLTKKFLLACTYYEGGGWSWAVKQTGMSQSKRLYAAAELLKEVTNDTTHPLSDKALYLRGRIYYWLNKEDSGLNPDTVSKPAFAALSSKYPGHEVLQMYMGKLVPSGLKEKIERVDGAPLWAVHQREAMYRMLEVIHWWVNEKQAANGELGGKYGDDVEILRWWLPAILGADDSTATLGYTRLADGVWNSGILERGFAKKIDDVEHSAELFRDTHPAMFLMNYGDPEYVERCMISMQNFKDVWTGITPRGHRHFKSYYLSATQVLEDAPYGVDVPLNARAVLPGLWLSWYNRNENLLTSFSEWCRAWIEDAERVENGKPGGMFPAAITYQSDKIGGYTGTWYDANLSYSYYKWESLGHISELYRQLLGMYAITNDNVYLKPVEAVVSLLKDSLVTPTDIEPGSLPWVKYKLSAGSAGRTATDHPMENVFAMAKKVSRTTRYDHFLSKYGQPYQKFEISNNTHDIVKGFDGLLKALQYNFPLLTSEVKFTDRVYVPGSNLLLGMYTGHFGNGFEYPALVATWKKTGRDVSILIRNGDTKSARVSLFNSGKQKTICMRTWQLEPGEYKIIEGFDIDDDGFIDAAQRERSVVLEERVNSIEMELPAKKNWTVSITQTKSSMAKDSTYPDLAVSFKDIALPITITPGQSVEVKAGVHNIGGRISGNAIIHFTVNGKLFDSANVSGIDAPSDLNPKRREVKFTWVAQTGVNHLAFKIVSNQQEITQLNNYISRTITIN